VTLGRGRPRGAGRALRCASGHSRQSRPLGAPAGRLRGGPINAAPAALRPHATHRPAILIWRRAAPARPTQRVGVARECFLLEGAGRSSGVLGRRSWCGWSGAGPSLSARPESNPQPTTGQLEGRRAPSGGWARGGGRAAGKRAAADKHLAASKLDSRDERALGGRAPALRRKPARPSTTPHRQWLATGWLGRARLPPLRAPFPAAPPSSSPTPRQSSSSSLVGREHFICKPRLICCQTTT